MAADRSVAVRHEQEPRPRWSVPRLPVVASVVARVDLGQVAAPLASRETRRVQQARAAPQPSSAPNAEPTDDPVPYQWTLTGVPISTKA